MAISDTLMAVLLLTDALPTEMGRYPHTDWRKISRSHRGRAGESRCSRKGDIMYMLRAGTGFALPKTQFYTFTLHTALLEGSAALFYSTRFLRTSVNPPKYKKIFNFGAPAF